MSLSEEARSRLADVVELQPTKNAELAERWGFETGKEVHRYLESNLSEFYFRDENSLIRATPEAASLVDVDPGIESDTVTGETVYRVDDLQGSIYSLLPDSPEDSKSVVSVLNAVRNETNSNPDIEEIRSAISGLRRMGVIEVEYRSVPTYYRGQSDSVKVLVQNR